jgi:hypothetical protein
MADNTGNTRDEATQIQVNWVAWPSAVISLVGPDPTPPGTSGHYGKDVSDSLAPGTPGRV